MNAKTQQILLHIAGWIVFLSLPLLFSPESLTLHAYLANPPTQRDLISYVLVLAVFYLNFYWLIPRLYFRKKYGSFLLIGVISFIPIVFLPAYIIPFATHPDQYFSGPDFLNHPPLSLSDRPDHPPAAGSRSDIHPDPSFGPQVPGQPNAPAP